MSNTENSPIIIEGITEDGTKFRPSDWAERMCGSLTQFRNRRIHYDPRLRPIRNQAGIKCIALDPALQDEHPKLYQSVLEFAQKNRLRIQINQEESAEE